LPEEFEIPDSLLTLLDDAEDYDEEDINSGDGLKEVLTELFYLRKTNGLEEFDLILDMRK